MLHAAVWINKKKKGWGCGEPEFCQGSKSKHNIFALGAIIVPPKPRWFLTWAHAGICAVAIMQEALCQQKEESSLNARCVSMRALQTSEKNAHAWGPSSSVSKTLRQHEFQYRRGLLEVFTVQQHARWLRISSNNLACHFMMRYLGKKTTNSLRVFTEECSVC